MKYTLLAILFISVCHGKVLRVGMSNSIPPYALPETITGIQVELIKKAVEKMGYEVVFTFAPNSRLIVEMENSRLDAIVNLPPESITAVTRKTYYKGDALVNFANNIIFLKSRRLKIDSLADLKGLEVMAFQNARNILGSNFVSIIPRMKNYFESPKQNLQVLQLMRGRVDVVISDVRIFNYYASKESPGKNLDSIYEYKSFFGKSPRSIVFYDSFLRDQFNKAYRTLPENLIKMIKEKKYE